MAGPRWTRPLSPIKARLNAQPRRVTRLLRGQALRLYLLFLKPIFDFCPEELDLEEWAAFMLGSEDRSIEQYEVTQAFDVPGIYKPTVNEYFLGYTANRKAKPGMRIFVRFHKNAPDKIEVEVPNDVGNAEKIFQLTQLDWKGIERFLLWIEPRTNVEIRRRLEKKSRERETEEN